ncbi:RadC family protein [Melghirimyces algeriensis]|uniref:DNA replication and repair protein RadC n=1 Tax=Melghirimyces algeriensis TaxID=910412 RepID=A0A521ARQ0_9BACL|nr:DNA repair protein RadC [Melghirimyces algeriensis]SMO37504.1 DNA replication and repair protein RadC [Melghirimyces algeriensis]
MLRQPEQLMIRDVPEEERPRERMSKEGPTALSNAELIAILLRTGTSSESVIQLAHQVLAQAKGLKGLADFTLNELIQMRGIGPAKAIQLLAGIEIGRRVSRALPAERALIRSPEDVADYVMDEMRYLTQEHFLCLFLNTKNRVIDKQCIFVGSLNSSVVHPREVFREAIRRSSAGVICIHNHPSGDPAPSAEDIQVTERLYKVGRIIGIELLDHIIIGDTRFYSMKEKGIIPV